MKILQDICKLFNKGGILRAPVKIHPLLTVDQFAYSEFSSFILNPAFLTVIDFKSSRWANISRYFC